MSCDFVTFSSGSSAVWLARNVRDVEAVGSSPTFPIFLYSFTYRLKVKSNKRVHPEPEHSSVRGAQYRIYSGTGQVPPSRLFYYYPKGWINLSGPSYSVKPNTFLDVIIFLKYCKQSLQIKFKLRLPDYFSLLFLNNALNTCNLIISCYNIFLIVGGII